jgi:hypothetical protein
MTIFTFITIFTKDCFNLVFIHKFDFPNIIGLETEVMILPNDLKLVRKLMGAYFIDIKQVYDLFFFAHVEVPNAIQLTSETMHRLISLY